MAAPKTEPKLYVGVALDFETGGLDCVKHACTQIAMQAVRFDTWEVFKQYVCYFSPYQKQELVEPQSEKSYEVNTNWTMPL